MKCCRSVSTLHPARIAATTIRGLLPPAARTRLCPNSSVALAPVYIRGRPVRHWRTCCARTSLTGSFHFCPSIARSQMPQVNWAQPRRSSKHGSGGFANGYWCSILRVTRGRLRKRKIKHVSGGRTLPDDPHLPFNSRCLRRPFLGHYGHTFTCMFS